MRRLVVIAWFLGCSSAQHGGDPDSSVDSSTGDALGAMPDSMPDGNGCAKQPCDILTQCGCGALESCDINDTDTVCRGTSGGKEGTSCITNTACAARYTCVFFGHTGSCMPYCATDTDCIAPRGQCALGLLDSADHPIPGVKLCSSNCDPTAISDPLCPAGWGCDIFHLETRDIADCRTAGAGTQGQACSDTAPCAPGFTCATTGATSQCGRICTPPANTGCPASTTCSAFTPPVVVAGMQYGVCL